MYHKYLDEAATELEQTLIELLDVGEKDIVVDRSLYRKNDRDAFKRLIEGKGARWILAFFRPVNKDVIWNRIQHRRRAGIDANSALDITPQILDGYWRGFENPEGEGEVVIDVTDSLENDRA